MAEKIANDAHTYFGTLPVTVQRILWEAARSFSQTADIKGIGPFPLVFIRAPSISDGRGRKSWWRSMAKPLACGMGIKSGLRSIPN
ncbi:MAG: hypothetical protein ACLVDB_09270 [Anaeromassilibacillus sp.]